MNPIDSFASAPGSPLTGILAPGSGVEPGLIRRQVDFGSILSGARTTTGTKEDQAREAAEEFVAIGLMQPLLANLRATNHAAPPFQPTQGERQFQAMLDAQVARQIVRRSNFPIVQQVARNLLEHSSAPRTDSAPATETAA